MCSIEIKTKKKKTISVGTSMSYSSQSHKKGLIAKFKIG